MISDDFDQNIEASMDDLDQLEYLPSDEIKQPRFHKTILPEIQENSALDNDSISQAYRGSDLIHRKTWSSLTMPFQERRRLSQCREEDGDEETGRIAATTAQVAGARRKFIVTRAHETTATAEPSVRREAENLRNLTEKTNAATIHFPCSSSTQRQSLAGLFSSRVAFNPHLDKRFFDSSLVRINAESSQSLNTSTSTGNSEKDNEQNIWQPRLPSPDRGSVSSTTGCDFMSCFF